MKDWRSVVIGILASALLTGTAAWMTLGRVAVTRAEMLEAITPKEKQIEAIAADVRVISTNMAAMTTQQAVMQQKLDTVVDQMKEIRKP